MKTGVFVQNVVETGRIVRADVMDFVRARTRTAEGPRDEMERRCAADLARNGVAVVRGFWNRERALALRDRLERLLVPETDREFASGAYLRCWDTRATDHGVRRIYHIEREVAEVAAFRHSEFVTRVVAGAARVPFHSGVLMYQHNTRTNENTRGYHVDAFSKQFKSFLYLDDVDVANGPFTYVAGSHRARLTRLKRQMFASGSEPATSFDERDLGNRVTAAQMICGPAGTLIIADVRGFHRGAPQRTGSRSVLVNYMYRSPGDVWLDR